MKKIFVLFFLGLIIQNTYSIDIEKITKEIEEEGKALYKLEMASWYGTDIFLEHYSNRENIGGYFSYNDGDSTKCIFFSREETPKMLGIVSFDSTFTINKASIEMRSRDFNYLEKQLFTIRQKTLERIHSDATFVIYENTNFNLIPIIHKEEKKVYILTGPQVSGVVLFGNDYLLTFDENNNIKDQKKLHRNLIPIEYIKDGEKAKMTMHSHNPETGDFITPTDICTLMLYQKFTEWEEHYVYSKNYLNIWDCEKNSLLIMTQKAINKIEKHSKKKKKK